MSKAHVMSLENVHEGSTWIRICERDPDISERSLSNGYFWTCDFSSMIPKPQLRFFDDNVWYLEKVHYENKSWDPDFEFTHWLQQGFYVPKITDEEMKEINDYRTHKALGHSGRLIYYI